MKIPKFLVGGFVASVFLMRCATSYHSEGLTGGYCETTTAPDSFIVTFKGNGYTSSEKVMRYALRRASELTLENGYKYFIVTTSADQTSSYNYSNTQTNVHGSANSYGYSNYSNTQVNGYGSSSTYSGRVTKPAVSIAIKCYKTKPWKADVIDAKYYLENN